MSKFFDKYSLVLKSIRKFWTLTFFFIVLLLTLQGIIPEIYSTVSKALKWDTINYIPFLLVCLLFTVLISQIFKSVLKKKPIEWKPWDAFIMACCLYSNYKLVFVVIDPFNLLFTFVSLASLYFLIKASFWFNGLRITKNTKTDGTNQLDQDQSLENTKDFENIDNLDQLKELDKLGRFDHAQQISHVINNIKPEKSFAIGINGEWGSGKTSFIHLVRKINQIEHPNQCKFIIFNPWYFTGTEKVLIKFHEALLAEVGSFSLSFRNELHRYFQLICNMENNLWKTNFLQYFQKQADFQSQLEKLKGYFKNLPQKIVIIIDDMDRLQKDEVLVLFRTMRLIADFPNVVYLVGYDPDYIETILGEKPDDNKSSFMGKVFQVQFDLPEPLPSDLINFWEGAINELIPKDKSGLQKRIIDNIVDNQIIPNLRDIKRFFNQLSINYSLPEIKDNTYLPQFFLLELIYYTDPTTYYKIHTFKIYNFESTKDVEIEKPSTIVITKQIIELAINDERSITKEEHFEKYFLKRLDKEHEVYYEHVVEAFNNDGYEKQLKAFYTTNKTQLVDHIVNFIRSKIQIKDSIDKTLATNYLDRILYLLEFSYIYEGLIQKYFENEVDFLGKRLIAGIVSIYKIFPYDDPKFIKGFEDYLNEKIELNCFSYLLVHLAKGSSDDRFSQGLSPVFQNRIRETAKDYSTLRENMSLLIDLYNYHQFCKNLNEYSFDSILLNTEICNLIRDNIKSIYSDIKRIKETNKNLGLLSFFGSKEGVLALNDMKNTDVFDILDKELKEEYYPVRQEKNSTEFTYTFKYDKYNYDLNFPISINKLIIKSMDGHVIYQYEFNQTQISIKDYPNFAKRKDQANLPKSINNYKLSFFRLDDGCNFRFMELNPPNTHTPKYRSEAFIEKINSAFDFEFELIICTDTPEEFIVKRQLIPDKVLPELEKKKNEAISN